MSDGGAQAHVITLTAYPSFKLYHYIEGTATAKDIYTDEAMTTPAAQPMVADATGTIQFYGDGMYKFVVDDSTDVTKHTWDNVRVSSDLATMGVNFGTTVPGATIANQGQLFAEHEATTQDFEALWINHGGGAGGAGPAFLKIIDISGGTIKYADIILGGPVIDVRYYGAVGDGVTDDSAAIQAAATAIPATGGTLYFPKGTYLMTADIDILNKSCHVTGDGIGISTIKWSAGSDYGIDFDATSQTDVLMVDNLTLHTDFAGAGDAINASWTSASGTNTTCVIRDIEISNTAAAISTGYFLRCISLSNASIAQIDNASFRGKANDTTGMTHGINVEGTSHRISITNCSLWYAQHGIQVSGTLSVPIISGNTIDYVDHGIHNNFSSLQQRHIITDNNIQAFTSGINCIYLGDSIISDNNITKYPTSTDNFAGISVQSTSSTLQLTGNSIREAGSSGTDVGILIDGTNCTISNNFIEDVDTGITGSGNLCTVKGSTINNTTTGISVDGNNLQVSSNHVIATTDCIIIDGDDCLVENNYTKDATNGITADTNSNTCYFIGNMSENNTSDYIDSGTNNRFESNYLPNTTPFIVGATTITLHPSGSAFEVTGTATVNTVTGSWDGRMVILYKPAGTAGTITLADATGNLRLLGGANRTIVAETTVQLMWNSSTGSWLQISESIN